MLNDSRDPTNLGELMHTVSKESGSEQNKKETGHLEEAAEIQSNGGSKESPAQENGGAYPEDGSRQSLNNIAGHTQSAFPASKKRGCNEESQFHALAYHGEKRQPKHSGLAGCRRGFIYASFEFAF